MSHKSKFLAKKASSDAIVIQRGNVGNISALRCGQPAQAMSQCETCYVNSEEWRGGFKLEVRDAQ